MLELLVLHHSPHAWEHLFVLLSTVVVGRNGYSVPCNPSAGTELVWCSGMMTTYAQPLTPSQAYFVFSGFRFTHRSYIRLDVMERTVTSMCSYPSPASEELGDPESVIPPCQPSVWQEIKLDHCLFISAFQTQLPVSPKKSPTWKLLGGSPFSHSLPGTSPGNLRKITPAWVLVDMREMSCIYVLWFVKKFMAVKIHCSFSSHTSKWHSWVSSEGPVFHINF